jgi:ABC-2 type transport system ATP-binding protein
MNNPALIEISHLTRKFKDKIALDEITLSINQGELFGLVGPDGAGKTTLLRTLAGLLTITDGSVQVNGININQNAEANKPRIGYMAQEFSLYEKLSVIENLRFFGDLYDVPPNEQSARIPALLEFANLTEFRDRRAAHLSGGMKKKLALASTLLHRPSLLLLDEPTTGVDPISRREFWNILNELHINGTTIFVSTPYMDEADRCSRVGLMYQGKVVVCDSPANIRSNVGADVIKIVSPAWQKARKLLESAPGVQEVQSYGEALHVLVDSARTQKQTIKKILRENQVEISEIREITPRMEEAFISLIRKMDRGH